MQLLNLFFVGAGAFSSSRFSGRSGMRMAAEPLAQNTGFANMDQTVLGKYMSLDTGAQVQCEYVFVDADGTARAKCRDPFRGGDNVLVLCDTYDPEGNALPTNSRAPAVAKFEAGNVATEKPWYGLEQEYTLFNLDGVTPLGWPVG